MNTKDNLESQQWLYIFLTVVSALSAIGNCSSLNWSAILGWATASVVSITMVCKISKEIKTIAEKEPVEQKE